MEPCGEKEEESREKIGSSRQVRGSKITLDQYYEEWKTARSGTIKGNTALNIECRYRNHIGPAMGGKKIADIEKREILKLQEELACKQKPRTVNITIVQLKNIFQSAVLEGIIASNPAAGIKPLKVDTKEGETSNRALQEKEQRVFMQYARTEWLYELMEVLLYTGMRVGEATALTWNDIDDVNRVIHIDKTVSRTAFGKYTISMPQNRTSIRDIPMDDIIGKALRRQWKKLNDLHGIVHRSRLIFENVYGGMVYNASVNKAISDTLKRIRKDGKEIVHFSAQALRNTFALRYLEQGGSPQELNALLGKEGQRVISTDTIRF